MDELFGLKGRVAVVTGGASGIGTGICDVLAEAGAKVIVADIAEQAAMAKADALNAAGYTVGAVALDLADEASVIAACARIVAEHGTPWLLVNNAGLQDRELLLEGTVAHWERLHAVNARGPFLMIREIGAAMVRAGKGGRIVNCASNSVEGELIAGLGAYVASKGAVTALTMASALELANHAITVNTVHPGGVWTPGASNASGPDPEGPGLRRQRPLGFCEPRDIASAVLYFASPAARYGTNQTLAVDAGFSVG
ncbi:MAG: SDR family oxidoreductase [Burkholderiales bacterium]|nr:MAG: SDR family oxidoreductase [Burkholderiales bacterium]